MSDDRLTDVPIVETGMRIRRPAEDVFEAFVDPEITTKFWFTSSTGRLEPGGEVRWEWGMYGVSAAVAVQAVEPHDRIVIEWPDPNGPTRVEWRFTPLEDGSTFVRITNTGFAGDADERVRQAMDSTQGFALVLAGLKAYLEHGIELNLVADRSLAGLERA